MLLEDLEQSFSLYTGMPRQRVSEHVIVDTLPRVISVELSEEPLDLEFFDRQPEEDNTHKVREVLCCLIAKSYHILNIRQCVKMETPIATHIIHESEYVMASLHRNHLLGLWHDLYIVYAVYYRV